MGCVCVCVCVCACTHLLITVLEDSGHDGVLGGGEPPAVSRAHSWARTFSPPQLFSGDACCPGLQPPKPTSLSQEDPWVLPACDPRLEAVWTVSGGRPGVCLVCPSIGDHCPVPTGV